MNPALCQRHPAVVQFECGCAPFARRRESARPRSESPTHAGFARGGVGDPSLRKGGLLGMKSKLTHYRGPGWVAATPNPEYCSGALGRGAHFCAHHPGSPVTS